MHHRVQNHKNDAIFDLFIDLILAEVMVWTQCVLSLPDLSVLRSSTELVEDVCKVSPTPQTIKTILELIILK